APPLDLVAIAAQARAGSLLVEAGGPQRLGELGLGGRRVALGFFVGLGRPRRARRSLGLGPLRRRRGLEGALHALAGAVARRAQPPRTPHRGSARRPRGSARRPRARRRLRAAARASAATARAPARARRRAPRAAPPDRSARGGLAPRRARAPRAGPAPRRPRG